MSLEGISAAFPGLIPGLLGYTAIGFIMVRSEKQGPLAIGQKGIYYLSKGRVEGENPLEAFGPLAASRLLREDSFSNAPDILVNSFFDAKSGEVAAFEELVGSHGGMGGDQSRGILIHPSEFDSGSEPIMGAEKLHQIIKRWLPAN
jgi:putative membrane protein